MIMLADSKGVETSCSRKMDLNLDNFLIHQRLIASPTNYRDVHRPFRPLSVYPQLNAIGIDCRQSGAHPYGQDATANVITPRVSW